MAKPDILQTGPYASRDDRPLAEPFVMNRLWETSDGAAFLAKAGPRSCGVATRGDLVADGALITALPALEIIAIDVFEPHAGAGTVATRRAMGALVLENLKAHFEGRPRLTPVL